MVGSACVTDGRFVAAELVVGDERKTNWKRMATKRWMGDTAWVAGQ
jgi:hypothetical protein